MTPRVPDPISESPVPLRNSRLGKNNIISSRVSSSRLLALIRPSTWKHEPEQSTFASNGAWSNEDMDPVPHHHQTWTTLSYIIFWISCVANVTVWELASS